MDQIASVHEILCKYRKNAPETLNGKVRSLRSEKARRTKSKIKDMPILYFNMTGSVPKEFVLAGHTVNSAYYCDVLQRLRENMLAPYFGEKKKKKKELAPAALQLAVSHFFSCALPSLLA
jgi:hypothetical protein